MGSFGRRQRRSQGRKPQVREVLGTFKARHFEPFVRSTGEAVTAEVLDPCFYPSPAERDWLVERLRHDVGLVAELGETDFVRYVEVVVTAQGRVALVMAEPLSAASLTSYLRALGGRVLPPLAYVITRRVLTALGELHGLGLVHRALSTDTIMLGGANGESVRVLDAGLGDALFEASLRSPEARGHVPGVLHYLAPEQYSALPVDGRADLYAAGVIFYEMLAGRHPLFDDDRGLTYHPGARRRMVAGEGFFPLGHFAPEYAGSRVEWVLARATSPFAHLRFQTAQELFGALDELWVDFMGPDELPLEERLRRAADGEPLQLTERDIERIKAGEIELVKGDLATLTPGRLDVLSVTHEPGAGGPGDTGGGGPG
ncbi:MAG TPA: protein kinase [Polyangiaceae bacterium]|nr:protein kinase [Polyangiaceae bacterium]